MNQDDLEAALRISNAVVCGLTDDGLCFNNSKALLCNSPKYLEKLFSRSEHVVALHSEDECIINANFLQSKQQWNTEISPIDHNVIRSELITRGH